MRQSDDDLFATPAELRSLEARLRAIIASPSTSPEDRGKATAFHFIVVETIKAMRTNERQA